VVYHAPHIDGSSPSADEARQARGAQSGTFPKTGVNGSLSK
jgi:hypothetical protein